MPNLMLSTSLASCSVSVGSSNDAGGLEALTQHFHKHGYAEGSAKTRSDPATERNYHATDMQAGVISFALIPCFINENLSDRAALFIPRETSVFYFAISISLTTPGRE